MAHWPWSSVQSSQEDRVPERYSPGLGVQEAQVDRTQTLRRPNSFETNPQFSFKFKAQSFKIPGLTASYSRVHPSFYLPCSCSSGLSSLPCLCPIVEEASLKPSNFSCGSRAPLGAQKVFVQTFQGSNLQPQAGCYTETPVQSVSPSNSHKLPL